MLLTSIFRLLARASFSRRHFQGRIVLILSNRIVVIYPPKWPRRRLPHPNNSPIRGMGVWGKDRDNCSEPKKNGIISGFYFVIVVRDGEKGDMERETDTQTQIQTVRQRERYRLRCLLPLQRKFLLFCEYGTFLEIQ